MRKRLGLLAVLLLCLFAGRAQTKTAVDSLPDYDALFSDLEAFLDSITAPHSFGLVNAGLTTGHFQYQTSSNKLTEKTQLILSPSVGYYHKSGIGATVVGSLIKAPDHILLYQTAASASYDYLKNRNFLTGVSVTRFFSKDSLPFYTSPLQNEASAYFTYRDAWLKPMLAVSYGWGNTTTVEERKEKIKLLKGKPLNSTTTIETTEAIADFSTTVAVKHDFYWLHVCNENDYIRLTPQVVAQAGTQKFGLAQTNNSYVSEKHSSTTVLYNTENNYVSAKSKFQLLSLSARLRSEYSWKHFFVQPQLVFDYFIPDADNKFATAFVINAGVLF